MVGLVLARSSVGLLRLKGVMRKYMNDAARLMDTITRRCFPDDFIRVMSLTPRPRPNPKIGPISGDTSIAPIITGIEFMLSPTEAITMANARMYGNILSK